MDKFLKFFTFSLFATLIVFASCGDDDDDDDSGPGTNPVDDIVNNLIAGGGDWKVATGGVKLESAAVEGWESFTLKLTGTADKISFSTTESANNKVWPGSGSWTFTDGSDGKKGTRSDDIEIDITVSANSLKLEFDITDGRTKGIAGRWSFTMEK